MSVPNSVIRTWPRNITSLVERGLSIEACGLVRYVPEIEVVLVDVALLRLMGSSLQSWILHMWLVFSPPCL